MFYSTNKFLASPTRVEQCEQRIEAIGQLEYGISMGWLQKLNSGKKSALTPVEKQQWAFFEATFALLAHIAKADGTICLGELATFDRFIAEELQCEPEAQRMAIATLVQARDSDEGFSNVAKRFAKLFDKSRELRLAMLETLHEMAMANGELHPEEEKLLNKAAKVFNIPKETHKAIAALYGKELDPWAVLECSRKDKRTNIEIHYKAIREQHNPQQLIEHGFPPEFVRLAQKRQELIDRAFDEIGTADG
ncbi:MAG: hypothetical protein A2289_11265 [Deltaproteobacteria bacterium RIFOXYA12_FULL_58_15]|nr:MAG: hypothetical protein A2289_11265 [Deltaproteobacteria bacterium RIFOXYA12_FULL_58_15]OGR14990.1 MAG: hypothetical protein A2341_17750 [Deltaproteobacteria bacterium RIFOXYB12_FULL_58_9]